METGLHIDNVAHVIQLAVAPVFLLSGIGALLAVLTNRIGRIVDRVRLLEGLVPGAEKDHRGMIGELLVLSRRARYINRAICLCTTCALLICSVIVVLFLGAFVDIDVSIAIALLFVAAMLTLIAGLLNFLREINLGTATLRIGPH